MPVKVVDASAIAAVLFNEPDAEKIVKSTGHPMSVVLFYRACAPPRNQRHRSRLRKKRERFRTLSAARLRRH